MSCCGATRTACIEGALIAAVAVGAREAVVAMKASFEHELSRVESAIGEMEQAGWCDGVTVTVVRGPSAYLFGEETALLEVVEGRQPFPRIAPPYRRGLDPADPTAGASAATVELAGPGGTDEPPALVDNVETIANVAGILAHGSAWFRELGTPQSPGTIVCTVTGHTRRHGVAEVPMGTPLTAIIEEIGGGAREGRTLVAAISGVANAFVPAAQFDTPAAYEEMAGIGSGLGAAGFIVLDDEVDPVAAAHAVARFLAVESCGQCEPCKLDGLAIADHLDAIRNSKATDDDLDAVREKVETVDRGARCALAQQQRRVVTSALALFPDCVDRHLAGDLPAATCDLMLPIVDLVEGQAILDTSHADKQPDWTYEPTWSGASPVDLLADQPVHVERPAIREAPTEPAGASVPDELSDPFREVLAGHRRIRDAAQRAVSAADDPAAAVDAIAALGDELRQHDDLGERVLYPLLDRHLGGAGDESSAGPRADLRDAIEQADRIAGDGSPAPDDVHDLIAIAEAHCDTEERTVLPLLRRRLDPAQLDELRDALAEAAHESDD